MLCLTLCQYQLGIRQTQIQFGSCLPWIDDSLPLSCASADKSIWALLGWALRACQLAWTCMQGKDLEEIIFGWNTELDARSRAFVGHAEALAEWDRHILHSRHALLSLEEDVLQASTSILCQSHRSLHTMLLQSPRGLPWAAHSIQTSSRPVSCHA